MEVAYARPDEQRIISVRLGAGATVGDAIRDSGILDYYPEIDLTVNAVGIFGESASLGDPLRAGDRVEIYRPLCADPKEARRLRAMRRGRQAG